MVSEKTTAVAVVMGSDSDWDTMQRCAKQLDAMGIAFEARIISAHRTPASIPHAPNIVNVTRRPAPFRPSATRCR